MKGDGKDGNAGKRGIAGNSYFNKLGKSKSTKGAAAFSGGLSQQFTMHRIVGKKSVVMGGVFGKSTIPRVGRIISEM